MAAGQADSSDGSSRKIRQAEQKTIGAEAARAFLDQLTLGPVALLGIMAHRPPPSEIASR